MRYFLPTVFVLALAAAIWLSLGPSPFSSGIKRDSTPQARVVSPKNQTGQEDQLTETELSERMAFEDVSNAKISLQSDETAIAIITQDFDGDPQDEQMIAVRRTSEQDGPIYIVYADFDEQTGGYRRLWDSATATTKPRTFNFFVKDLIGDRSLCVITTGMNGNGEQTLMVFHKQPVSLPDAPGEMFERIAELRTDGSISIVERDRSQAYQLGLASGTSHRIFTYGRDFDSSNLLDQIETVYDFNADSRIYARTGVARIPGAQIEQRRVRQLLDGTPDKFERFLDGLWYLSSPTGEDSSRQYLLFDQQRNELVFYADATQEVFTWENSSATRYGLYLNTKNISVTTLRRLVDIELESVDSIRVKVFEDVRLKIGIGGRWDGTYRKMDSRVATPVTNAQVTPARVNLEYDGSEGKIRFIEDGSYEGPDGKGIYSFFLVGTAEYLELRKSSGTRERLTYAVERKKVSGTYATREELHLKRVRLGVGGAEDMHETVIVYSRELGDKR
jgi:hypothetical protein